MEAREYRERGRARERRNFADCIRLPRTRALRPGKLDQACESPRININRTYTYTSLICITTRERERVHACMNTYGPSAVLAVSLALSSRARACPYVCVCRCCFGRSHILVEAFARRNIKTRETEWQKEKRRERELASSLSLVLSSRSWGHIQRARDIETFIRACVISGGIRGAASAALSRLQSSRARSCALSLRSFFGEPRSRFTYITFLPPPPRPGTSQGESKKLWR